MTEYNLIRSILLIKKIFNNRDTCLKKRTQPLKQQTAEVLYLL